MSFLSLLGVEFKKLRRSKILLILIIPVFLIWITAVTNANINFRADSGGISPKDNFFIQSLLGFSWFMLPSSLVIITVLIFQIEYANNGILKMLSLPVSSAKLCLAKLCVLIILMGIEILMMFSAYFPSAIAASKNSNYNFMLDPIYIFKIFLILFILSIPMASVYWLISVLLKNPVASIGVGLATVVPVVLAINTKAWFAYPMCYPMMMITHQMHKLATKLGSFPFDLIPMLPVAVLITASCCGISCIRFGKSARK